MMLNGFRLLLAVSMVLALWGGAYAWEGRMGGMGDPYGLVSDESDLFILPTRIVDGTGIQYYGDVRFMYHDLSDMNWNARLSGSLGFLGDTITGVDFGGSWGSSGNVWDYSTRVGVTLPAGTGRLGLFFKYTGQRGSYDGTQTLAGSIDGLGSASAVSSYNMRSDYDDFNFRITYGRPLGSDLRIGGEIQVGYHQETNKYRSSLNSLQVLDSVGDPVGIPALALQMENDFLGTLFPFMKPFDSSYWEMLFKAGVEGHFGPAWIGMDVRGGPLFGGDNTWSQSMNGAVLNTDGTTIYSGAQSFRLKGDVSGWKLGGDFWLRVPVSDSLSVPFSVTVDYLEKTRDGSGIGTLSYYDGDTTTTISGFDWAYKNTEKKLGIEAGGGVEKQISKDLKVAAGLYYNYIHNEESMALALDTGFNVLGESLVVVWDNNKFPVLTEHLVKLKLLAERKMDSYTLRCGLSAFGGPVTAEYSSVLGTPLLGGVNVLRNQGSLDGTTWGITGSFGATTKIQGFVVEPFVQAGYQKFDLSGPGGSSVLGNIANAPWSLNQSTSTVLVGGGVSASF